MHTEFEDCEVASTNTTPELSENEDIWNGAMDVLPVSNITLDLRQFSGISKEGTETEIFEALGYKWRVIFFARGEPAHVLSVYLQAADNPQLPYKWPVFVQFSFGLYNQNKEKVTFKRGMKGKFWVKGMDWGLFSFIPLCEIYNPTNGFLLNDKLTVVVTMERVADFSGRDSDKATGFVGLKNQGATCYLNSLLQMLYHIPYFRKAVYHMPTYNTLPSTCMPLALQILFYNIQHNNHTVSTEDLTMSFGWGINDIFKQHDVQEMNRILCEKLENKMKGTAVEGTIQMLFQGHLMNYIECVNVDYKSTHKDPFYDLQLDVRGCKDVYASLDKYVQVEKLEGENRYEAAQFGLQDARKGVLFVDFPPVLQLHLKRFEYDVCSHSMIKINDTYKFPLLLDLDKNNGQYLSPDRDRSLQNRYSLYSVLVHSGGVHGGHYYAFIRPMLSNQWYKFNDECVTRENLTTVLEEQYGGDEEISGINHGFNDAFKLAQHSSAYMLVYVRESDKDDTFCKIEDKDIAEHLKERFRKKLHENDQKLKEDEEAHLYTNIKVVTDDDLFRQTGKNIPFHLVDFDNAQSFQIKMKTPISQFKELLSSKFRIPLDCQRLWLWKMRVNNSYFPLQLLTEQEECQAIGELKKGRSFNHAAELRFFLEVHQSLDKTFLVPPPPKSEDDILLFFQLYNPEKEELQYVGRKFVKETKKPLDDLEKLINMSGLKSSEGIEFYEIYDNPDIICCWIDKMKTYGEHLLRDGDIICLQRAQIEGKEYCRYPTVMSYFHAVKDQLVVHFRKSEKPEEDAFILQLNRQHTYDEVVENLAHHLGLDDPSRIRLTAQNAFTQQPREHPVKYRGVNCLHEMLLYENEMSDTLYYDIQKMPLPELERMKVLKVSFYNTKVQKVSVHDIMLPGNSTVRDVIKDLKEKVELSNEWAELRILQISNYNQIYKIISPGENIECMVNKHFRHRAEEIPEEERNMGPQDSIIHVYYFRRNSQNNITENIGEPFFILTRSGETLGQLKERIKKKLQVPDDQFSEFKFYFVHLTHPKHLEDSDTVGKYFKIKPVYGPWEFYLGLEHTDNKSKQLHRPNQIQKRHKYLKICN